MPIKVPVIKTPTQRKATHQNMVQDYKVKPNVKLDRNNLWMLEGMKHARPLQRDHVGRIHMALVKGKHFNAPIVVNDVSTSSKKAYRLIDGNHRIEAIKTMLRANPNMTIEVTFFIYDHLTEQQEHEVFDSFSRGKKAGLADHIYVNQTDFPILQMMLKSFPTKVHIYSKKDQVGFRFLNLVKPYLYWMRSRTGGVGGGKDLLMLDRIKRMGKEEYENLRSFTEAYIHGFGEPNGMNVFNNLATISALMKTYFCNLEALGHQEIQQRWAKRVAKDQATNELCKTMGLTGAKYIGQAIVAAMNKGTTKNQAVTVEEWVASQGSDANGSTHEVEEVSDRLVTA